MNLFSFGRQQPCTQMTTTKSNTERLALAMANIALASRVWRAILVLIVIVVGYMALMPAPPKRMDLGWDKLNHLAAFAVLACIGLLSFPASRRHQVVTMLGLIAYGGAIEICQLFVPGRSCEWADLFADLAGIACGALVAVNFAKGKSRPPHRSLH
jgi:VanZ family protein